MNRRETFTSGAIVAISIAAACLGRTPSLSAEEPGLPVDSPPVERKIDFSRDVLPTLKSNCLACHNAKASEGDLSLETPKAVRKGGSSGPAVVPGDAAASLLFRLASHRDEPIMPPAENDSGATNLTPEELGLLKAWIDQGAADGAAQTESIAWSPLEASYSPIFAADISADGRYAAAARGNRVTVYDIVANRAIGRLVDPVLSTGELYAGEGVAGLDAVQSLAFSGDGLRIATGGFRTVRIWRRSDPLSVAERANVGAALRRATLSPDGKLIAGVGADGSIRLFDRSTGVLSETFGVKAVAATDAAHSTDSRIVFAGTESGAVAFSVSDGAETGRVEAASEVVTMTVAGEFLALGRVDGQVQVAPIAAFAGPGNAGESFELAGHSGPVTALASEAGGSSLVSVGLDGTARLWDLAAKTETRRLDHGLPLSQVAVSPDGSRLAAAAIDGSVTLWNLADGSRIAEVSAASALKLRESELLYAVEVARLRERTAKSDFDEHAKRERAESDVADAAELFALEMRLAAASKTADAEKAIAEETAAKKTFAEAQAALEAAEAEKVAAESAQSRASASLAEARKQREAGAVDEAAVKAAEEAEKVAVDAARQAGQAAAEATKNRDEAKREADRLRPIAQKAIDERTVAEGAAATSAREAIVTRERAAATLASLPRAEQEWLRSVADRREREAASAAHGIEREAKQDRMRDRAANLATALRDSVALRARRAAETSTDEAPPPQPSDEIAQAASQANDRLAASAEAAEGALHRSWTAGAEKRQASAASAAAKLAAEEALRRANDLAQLAAARKESADKALADANAKLSAASNDDEKELRRLAVAIAERNASSASKALEHATAQRTAAEANVASANASAAERDAAANENVRQAAEALVAAKASCATALAAALVDAEKAGGVEAAIAAQESVLSTAREALARERSPLVGVEFSPTGDRIVCVDEAGDARFYFAATGEFLHGVDLGDGGVVGAEFDGEDRLVALFADGSLVAIPCDPTWTLERTVGTPDTPSPFVDRVTALAFDPSGTKLAAGGGEPSRTGELKLLDVESGALLREFPDSHSDTTLDVAFSSDGASLASCGADRRIKVFDVATGELRRTFEGHSHHVLALDWRADDRLLASGSADLTLKTWDLRTGELARTIQGLPKEATSLRFLGAGDEFAVAVGDQQLAVRNVGGGTGATFAPTNDFVYVIRASADGQRILAAGQDGTVRVWDRSAKLLGAFPPEPSPTASLTR